MPFGGQKLKYPPEMKIYIGIFVHESYAKCKARLVGLIDNDEDVFYLILLYYNHFTQKPDGSVCRALVNEFFAQSHGSNPVESTFFKLNYCFKLLFGNDLPVIY